MTLSIHKRERYLTSVRYDRLFLCLSNSPFPSEANCASNTAGGRKVINLSLIKPSFNRERMGLEAFAVGEVYDGLAKFSEPALGNRD